MFNIYAWDKFGRCRAAFPFNALSPKAAAQYDDDDDSQ